VGRSKAFRNKFIPVREWGNISPSDIHIGSDFLAVENTNLGLLEELRLLGCYAVWLVQQPAFRRNLIPFLSGRQESVKKTLAVTSNRLLVTAKVFTSSPILVSVMMEVLNSFESSVLTRAIPCNIPEGGIIHIHRLENLKSYKQTNSVGLIPRANYTD
jgi:hypothetical protein